MARKKCPKCGNTRFSVSGEGKVRVELASLDSETYEILEYEEIIYPEIKDLDHVLYHCTVCEHEL